MVVHFLDSKEVVEIVALEVHVEAVAVVVACSEVVVEIVALEVGYAVAVAVLVVEIVG